MNVVLARGLGKCVEPEREHVLGHAEIAVEPGQTFDFIMGRPLDGWLHWWTPVIGAALWPPLFVLLDGLRVGRKH